MGGSRCLKEVTFVARASDPEDAVVHEREDMKEGTHRYVAQDMKGGGRMPEPVTYNRLECDAELGGCGRDFPSVQAFYDHLEGRE